MNPTSPTITTTTTTNNNNNNGDTSKKGSRIKALLLVAAVAGGSIGLSACGDGNTVEPTEAVAASSTAPTANEVTPTPAATSADATGVVLEGETFADPPAPQPVESEEYDEYEAYEENNEFGFSHGIPRGFTVHSYVGDNDGTAYINEATGVSLAVFGSYEVAQGNAAGEFPMHTSTGIDMLQETWAPAFELRGENGDGTIWREIQMDTGSYFVVVSIEGPADAALATLNETMDTLFVLDPSRMYNDQDIATIDEDDLLIAQDENGETPEVGAWFFYDSTYHFGVNVPLDMRQLPLDESIEYINDATGETISISGQTAAPAFEGEYAVDLPVWDDEGNFVRTAAEYVEVTELDGGSWFSVDGKVDLGTHWVVVRAEGPDVANLLDLYNGVSMSLMLEDTAPAL